MSSNLLNIIPVKNWRSLPNLRQDSLVLQDTSGVPKSGDIVPCLLCTKPFQIRLSLGRVDQVCPDCWQTYLDCAVVVCRTCRVTIGRTVPKMLDSGFYVRPRMVLHINKCNICDPGLDTSVIIEIDEWMKSMRPKKLIAIPSTIIKRT